MSRIELAGIEAHTLELTGRIPAEVAARRLPAALTPREDRDGVELGVLAFAMRGLGLVRPVRIGPRFDYGELLWRIGVTWRGEAAWFATTCDLDRAAIRAMGAWLVRYPVRAARITLDARALSVHVGTAALAVRVGEAMRTCDPVAPRPVLVGGSGRLSRIPWREEPAPERGWVSVEIDDGGLGRATLGAEITWDRAALAHAGRRHRCGIAVRVRA